MALIDKASLLMVPSVYEDGTLYNILPSGNKAPDETGNHNGYDQTRADFTFSRGANLAATRVNAAGLIEKGRENLLTHSNNFSDTDWVKFHGSSVTSGQADKDGGTEAWKLDIVSSQSFSGLYQTITNSGVRTQSIYAKAGTLDHLGIVNMSGAGFAAWFDLTNGTIGTQGGSNIDAKIEAVGTDGWYRISITQSVTNGYFQIKPSDGETTPSGSDGYIYIQDTQSEAGLVATDYIETTTTTAKAGVLENMPRIDYSSGAGALLLEPLRTNLLPHSEYFGAWTAQTGITLTPNTDETTSPEGLNNAYKIVSTIGTTGFYYGGLNSTAASIRSIYLKGALGGETLVLKDPSGFGASTSVTLTTEWQRFTHSTSNTGDNYQGLWIDDISVGTIYAYGAQWEEASYVSSYIPTMGTAASRAADSFSVDSASAHINSVEGTIYLEAEALHDDGSYRGVSLNDGTFTNMAQVRFSNTSNQITGQYKVGGSNTCLISEVVTDTTQRQKIAFRYKANDFKMYVNGVDAGSDTSGATNSANTFDEIKSNRGDGSDVFYGRIYKYILFNEGLSNSELESLTS